MKNIYQVFDAKQSDGKWFKKFEVPAELDLPPGYVDYDPPENIVNPRFIFGTGWVEDDDALLASLKQENAELKSRLDMSEGAILDLADQILAVKGGAV